MELPRTILHWILVAAATGAIAFFCVGLTSYFERSEDKPRWVGAIHDAGLWLSLAHLGGVIFLQPRSDPLVIAGIVMYTAAVAVFLAAIEAADRTRLQRMYVDQPLPDRLITDGPYHWVRHPFYLGYIIGALAPVVAVDHWVMPLTVDHRGGDYRVRGVPRRTGLAGESEGRRVSGVPPSHRDVSSLHRPRVTLRLAGERTARSPARSGLRAILGSAL